MNLRQLPPAIQIALGVTLLGLLALLFTVDPAQTRLFPPCPFWSATGLYCPGCGSLRACHRLLHVDLAGALAMNPLMVCAIPILPLIAWRRSWCFNRWTPGVALVILVAYGIARNIPCWPFTLLAPG